MVNKHNSPYLKKNRENLCFESEGELLGFENKKLDFEDEKKLDEIADKYSIHPEDAWWIEYIYVSPESTSGNIAINYETGLPIKRESIDILYKIINTNNLVLNGVKREKDWCILFLNNKKITWDTLMSEMIEYCKTNEIDLSTNGVPLQIIIEKNNDNTVPNEVNDLHLMYDFYGFHSIKFKYKLDQVYYFSKRQVMVDSKCIKDTDSCYIVDRYTQLTFKDQTTSLYW